MEQKHNFCAALCIILIIFGTYSLKALENKTYIYKELNNNYKILVHENTKVKLLNLPGVRQATTYTCGVSSLQSVLMYYGIEKREGDLANEMSANPENGVPPSVIVKTIEKYGLKADLKQNMTIEELENYIDKQIPVIVDIQAWKDEDNKNEWKNDWDDGHYVVFIGYNDENLYFEDPSLLDSIGYMNKKEFVDRWHDYEGSERTPETETHHLGIAVSGKQPEALYPVLHID